MKNILGLISALVYFGTCMASEEGFITRLNITGFPDSTKVIARIHDGLSYDDFRFDTVCFIDSKAIIRDVSLAEDPSRMYLFTDRGTICTYVQNGVGELISGSADDIAKETLTYEGAPWSNDMMDFNREVDSFVNEVNKLSRKFMSMTDEERKNYQSMSEKATNLRIEYFKSHPNSWHSLMELETEMMNMDKSDVQKIFDALEPDQRNSKYGKVMERYLSIRSISEGESLNDFNIIAIDQNGVELSLNDLREPYILLDFSQLNCGPCMMAVKEIHELMEKYADKVAFINYACDNSEDDWRKTIERDNITWPSLYDGTGTSGQVSLLYGVNSYPTFFLFGPDRKLINRTEGYGPGMLEKYLSFFLKQ